MEKALEAQVRMNDHDHRTLNGLLANAKRDQAALAKAQARPETLRAALEISAAGYLIAYGERPWPREVAR